MEKIKGFTLIELLATITILGIVMVVTIPAVNRWISRGKTESLNSQKQTLIMAARSYSEDHPDSLPKNIGEKSKITAILLRQKNYLKSDIVNADKKSCMENSYVEVYKNKKNSYQYKAFLYCEGDTIPGEDIVTKPYISIEFTDEKDNVNYMNNVSITEVRIHVNGGEEENSAIKLKSYSYLVSVNYSDDPEDKIIEIYNSGSMDAYGKTSISLKKSLNDYVDITKVSNFIVKATAYNELGGYSERLVQSSYHDTIKPICGKITGQAGEDEWDNTWRRKTITVECSDGDGSGCVKDSYTHTFDTQMNIGTITISDNAGNTTDCPVRVHLDWTTPTVTINAYKRNDDGSTGVKVGTVTADDTHQNVSFNSYTGGYGSNSWLNLANFPYGIVYEIITEDNVILNEGTWYENARELWLPDPNIDTLVKKSTKTFTNNDNKDVHSIVDEGFRRARFVFNDKALNTVTFDISSPIDRTRPKATASKSNPGTESGVTVTVNCTDSGSKCQRNQTVYTGVKSTQKYYVLDNAGNQNSESTAPEIVVVSYPCHPYEEPCGSVACGQSCTRKCCERHGSYICDEYDCGSSCSTVYCTVYCTRWRTCYD